MPPGEVGGGPRAPVEELERIAELAALCGRILHLHVDPAARERAGGVGQELNAGDGRVRRRCVLWHGLQPDHSRWAGARLCWWWPKGTAPRTRVQPEPRMKVRPAQGEERAPAVPVPPGLPHRPTASRPESGSRSRWALVPEEVRVPGAGGSGRQPALRPQARFVLAPAGTYPMWSWATPWVRQAPRALQGLAASRRKGEWARCPRCPRLAVPRGPRASRPMSARARRPEAGRPEGKSRPRAEAARKGRAPTVRARCARAARMEAAPAAQGAVGMSPSGARADRRRPRAGPARRAEAGYRSQEPASPPKERALRPADPMFARSVAVKAPARARPMAEGPGSAAAPSAAERVRADMCPWAGMG